MKRIILSLMMITGVSAAMILGSRAYFSDTETSSGNVLAAGTIDISVDGENPWTETYLEVLPDLKPGDYKEITFTVKNEGVNPLVLRKSLATYVEAEEYSSEPKCSARLGDWDHATKTCLGATDIDHNISTDMLYSMTVVKGGETIEVITEDTGTTMAHVEDLWFPLGDLVPGEEIVITQKYLLRPEAENRQQGEKVTFDIELYAEQRMGPGPNTVGGVILDNKTGSPDWYPVVDGTWGILTWDASGVYEFRGYGLDDTLSYSLVYWNEVTETEVPFGTTTSPVSGELTLTGTNAGLTTNDNAKYWLRPQPWTVDSDVNTLWEVNRVN